MRPCNQCFDRKAAETEAHYVQSASVSFLRVQIIEHAAVSFAPITNTGNTAIRSQYRGEVPGMKIKLDSPQIPAIAALRG